MLTKGKVSSIILVALLCVITQGGTITWSPIPSIRSGQISSIVTLTTSSDTDPSVTDQTATYSTPITATSNFKYGLSLMSYQSWMTDTFSFNISLIDVTNSSISVRFVVLDNTFFTKAKVHYIVVWRPNAFPNNALAVSPPVDPSSAGGAYNNFDVGFGCYLTSALQSGSGNRSVTVGGNVSTTIYGANRSELVMYSMIAGMQLSNNLGNNDFVKVQTSLLGGYFFYNVTVQNNNYLKTICLTTVIFDPYVNTYYGKSIIQHQSMVLNYTGTGLKSIPYSERYDGSSRMFFGFSEFNLSMADTRYLNIETSNISLVSLYYEKTVAMHEVVINMLFFAFRTCDDPTQYFYPVDFTCGASCPSASIAKPPAGFGSADFLYCDPCHYSCNTCTVGQDSNACVSPCPSGSHRTFGGGSCPCQGGYTDIGQVVCVICGDAMPGCVACTSSTVCTACDNITYVLNVTSQRCGCAPNYYQASGYCLSYSGCLVAIKFNNTLACTSCDTSRNYVRVMSNQTCACNQGYFLNSSVPECYDICGDGITALGHCDDNNTDFGDGCDENCAVQNGYHCYTIYNSAGDPGLSHCILITDVTVTYLYSKRVINTNKFVMAFKLDPMKAGLNSNSFNSTNFVTTLPIQNQKITYDPTTSTVFLEAEYLESIEGTSHTLSITYPNDLDFYADNTLTQFVATGINAKLTLDSKPSYNTFLPYLVIAQGALAIILAIFASVVGLKLAGIQLLIPVQLLYFSLAAVGAQSSYASTLSNLKYSNGYSVIATYDYFRTYSQNANLVAIAYETEFLLSTNIMLGLFLITLVWLLVHHIRIKCKENNLEELLKMKEDLDEEKPKEVNSDESSEKDDPEVDEEKVKLRKKRVQPLNQEGLQQQHMLREEHHYSLKIFSFEVDRFFFIFYVILINQMLFGFTVMSLNLPLSSFYYAEQISVIVCNFLTFILLGIIVFIFYDQTSNKMINFTCINDRYAYLYLILNTLIILVIVYTFEQSFSIFMITSLAAFFVVLVIVERPYNKNLIEFQNLVALYLQIMLFACLVMLCIMKTSDLTENLSLIVTFTMVGLIGLGEILTIIRIIAKVNFKKAFDDLKSPFGDRDNDNKKNRRVIQKNLDLLGKNDPEILPPDSVRNGLFTPKDKMIDWEARNTEEYESARLREGHESRNPNEQDQNGPKEHEQEESEGAKDSKLNELQLLKKRLRNTLKVKRENESKKTD